MRNIELKSRRLLRKIFGGISLTAVAFVFYACYGPGPDPFYDVKLTGTVKSKTTHLPIKGIKIVINDGHNYGFTDKNGQFDFYASIPNYAYQSSEDNLFERYTPDSVSVHFMDVDGIENGYFEDKTIIINSAHKDEVKINVELEEKQ